MRLAGITAACVLAAITLTPVPGSAAQHEFDIDLKELRRGWTEVPTQHNPQPLAPAPVEIKLKELRRTAPPLPAKPARNSHNTSPADVTTTGVPGGEPSHESIHVVRQGEHMFLILMQQYGLSNNAAELLIPEVMRLNGVTSPKALKVGQRLRIPLPYKNRQKAATSLVAEPEANLPEPAAEGPIAFPPVPDKISILQASPCTLAKNLLEKLGLLVPSTISIQGVETVSAAFAERSITVACGLSKAELYTYERLLKRNNKRLLSFDEGELSDGVVEKLANQLGLVFSKQDNKSEDSSTTYCFEPFAAWTHGLQLTIAPVPRDTDRKVKDSKASPKE